MARFVEIDGQFYNVDLVKKVGVSGDGRFVYIWMVGDDSEQPSQIRDASLKRIMRLLMAVAKPS